MATSNRVLKSVGALQNQLFNMQGGELSEKVRKGPQAKERSFRSGRLYAMYCNLSEVL